MVFSSIVFLCGFLPLVLFIYRVLPVKMHNLWLLLASLFFYGWGEPKYILIMLFSTVFDYCNGRLIDYFRKKKEENHAKIVMIVSVVGNLGILGFFKYTDFLIETFNGMTGLTLSLLRLALPVGISFYTFQTMSYTIDVYRNKVNVQTNIIDFGMYVSLFPQLIAGPIVRYGCIEKEIVGRKTTEREYAEGIQRFIIGLGKKVLLANKIGELWDEISATAYSDMSVVMAWLGAIAFMFQIYFDFSGYSDMAIGIGKMLGFHFPENFEHPYESKSVTEFWRRWHMTLSSWFREYVYIPLGGNRKGKLRQVINLFIVWFLTGFWHGAGWNFIFWGLYFFVLIVLEKFVLSKYLDRLVPVVRHAYTLFLIAVSWVIFANVDIARLGQYLKAMFGVGVPVINDMALYQWTTHFFLYIILAIGCTTFPKRFAENIWDFLYIKMPEGMAKYKKEISFAVTGIFSFIVLFICIIYLVSGSYNPFLYFRF